MLLSAVITILVIVGLRRIPELYRLNYAFYLFGTLIHELGHVTGAVLSGGRVTGFVVHAGSGGYASVAGGNPWVVLPAGYFGSVVFGSIFFLLANRYRRWTDLSAVLIGGFILVMTIIFGRPEENGALTAHIVAGVFGSILLWAGWKRQVWLSLILVNLVTSLAALQGLTGAWTLHLLSEADHHNDANMMAEAVGWFSGNTWALIWAGFSVVLFSLAVYFGPWKSIRNGRQRDWDYSWED